MGWKKLFKAGKPYEKFSLIETQNIVITLEIVMCTI